MSAPNTPGPSLPMTTERIRVFAHLIGRRDAAGVRVGPRQAWRVAGIATGQVAAMPDSVIEWWWKVHDLLPSNVPAKPTTPASPTRKSSPENIEEQK